MTMGSLHSNAQIFVGNWLLIGLALILGLIIPSLGGANIYQCTDPSGRTVFTDSPAQLEHCTAFKRERGEEPASSDPSGRPRLDSARPQAVVPPPPFAPGDVLPDEVVATQNWNAPPDVESPPFFSNAPELPRDTFSGEIPPPPLELPSEF